MTADGCPPFTAVGVSVTRGVHESAVAPYGELDLASTDELTAQVHALWAGGSRCVLIDLSPLEFMDSSGLRGLLELREAAAREGNDLALRPGPPVVQRIFDLTGTRRLFDWR